MRKVGIPLLIFLLVGGLATACSRPLAAVSPTPTGDLVGTIVAGTMEAQLSATPEPSNTPRPTNAPTATVTLSAPAGWVVYTNEQYGFELVHPNLYDCKDQCGIGAFISLGDIQNVTTLAIESTLTRSGASFDGLSLDVFLNPDAMTLQEFVEQEKQAILAGPGLIGPPLNETPYLAGGQTGMEMSLTGNISSAIYIPFPNSNKILIFSTCEQNEGSFAETARQIVSTLRFTK